MCYNYRYVLTDLLGNTFTATSSSTAWVDYAGAVKFETPGVVSQLRFGDSSINGNVTAADSVGSLNPTYVNGVTQGVSGDLPNDSNTAVTLNGTNQYIQDTTPTGMPTGSAARSVEMWFKTSATTQQSLFAYGSFANGEEFGLWINAGGSAFTAWGWGGAYDETYNAPSSVEDGKWHQVVETYDGSVLTVYLDGVALGSPSISRDTVVDTYGLQIGDVVDPGDPNSGFYFKGSLDEFSVYNVALSQTEVTNHYQLGANTSASSTGPTGGSVAVSGLTGTGSLYSTSTGLNLTLAKGTATNGLAASGAYLFRASAPLTSTGTADGVCGTFSAYSLIATDPAASYTDTVSDSTCYAYRYSVPDALGNYSTYASGLVKVDTTAPATPTFVFSGLTATYASGSILYYRPTSTTGSVTVTVTATDPTSGIASYAFPTFGTNWTSTGTGAAKTYSWNATPAGSGTETVTVTNNAGSSSTASFTLTPDTTAPTGGSISYTNGSQTSHTTPITFAAGTDSGSGIGSVVILASTASYSTRNGCGTQGAFGTTVVTNPASSPYSDTALAKGCYMFELKVTDNVGNVSIYTSPSVLAITQ
jgi:hypothetical protein